MAALRWGEPLTVEDLEGMPDDGHRYELVDGTLLVTPAPATRHQMCVVQLSSDLLTAAGREHLVLVAPYDWVVGPSTLFQPDLLVALRSDVGEKRLERPPLLVVEVLSPSTRRVDLATKRMAYADAGVPDYWVIDPGAPSIVALHLEADGYAEIGGAVGSESWVASSPFTMTVTPATLVD